MEGFGAGIVPAGHCCWESGQKEKDKKGKIVLHGRDWEHKDAPTVLSSPVALKEAFCQHWLKSQGPD